MKLLLQDTEAARDQWLELRRKSVGSSDIAVLCGFNQYRSPLDLWMEKTGRQPPFEGNDHTWLGHQMEKAIGGLFARRNKDLEVQKCLALYGHDSIPFIHATPDFWLLKDGGTETATEAFQDFDSCGYPIRTLEHREVPVSDIGLLEAKNTNARNLEHWEETAPTWAQVQLQWQMGICGIKWGYVAGLVGGSADSFMTYRFEFSPEVFDQCVMAADEFMEYVRRDIPPAASAGDRKLVEKIVGDREKGKSSALPPSAYPVVRDYMRLAAIRKSLEKQAKEVKRQEDGLAARILQLMSDAELAETPWGVSFKASKIVVEPYVNEGYSYVRLYEKGKFQELDEEEERENEILYGDGSGRPLGVFNAKEKIDG